MGRTENVDPAPGMSAAERQSTVVTLLHRHKRVDVTALANLFAVADETIRRDLRTLEKHGRLARVHGGAVPRVALVDELPRITGADVPPHPLTEMALELLPERGSVFLDSGPICQAVAAALPANPELQVVTNSIPVALSASRHEQVAVYNLGGTVHADGEEFGQWARELIEDLGFDLAMFCLPAIGRDGAARTQTPHSAAIKRLALEQATRTALLVDDGAVEPRLISYAHARDFTTVLSAGPLPATLAAELSRDGVTVGSLQPAEGARP